MMAVYPAKLSELIRKPKYANSCARSNGVGSDANFACGCFVRFSVAIDEAERTVSGVGYETNGCGYMIGAAELIAGKLSEKALGDLHGLGDEEAGFVADGFYAEGRRGCVDAVMGAVKAAFADHRSRLLAEFTGEKALICTCFGVSEETIEQYVAANRPSDSHQVAEAIKAGSGCGSCRMLIQEIIDTSYR